MNNKAIYLLKAYHMEETQDCLAKGSIIMHTDAERVV